MTTTDQTLAERIRDAIQTFTPSERKTAHVLLANYPVAGLETVAEFASRAAVSAPTVLRFVARIGFPSYPEFQRALREELDAQGRTPLAKPRFDAGGGPDGPMARFRDALVANLQETFAHLPAGEVEEVIALLADRRRPVHAVGGRFTDAVARHLVAHLRVIRPLVAHVGEQPASWRDRLVDMGPKDVLVVFDIRRYQDDLRTLAAAAARTGATVVVVTDQWLSPVARHARHVLAVRVEVPSRWDSLVAILAVVEAIVAAVTERTWEEASRRIVAIDAMKDAGASA